MAAPLAVLTRGGKSVARVRALLSVQQSGRAEAFFFLETQNINLS